MKILEYIDSVVTDISTDVLEIGTWHGMLSDLLNLKGIKITAAESMTTAPIWKTPKSYPVKLLGYSEALSLKHWDLVIANNVIHHLHSPYHFWDVMGTSCDNLIVSGCVSPETIKHWIKEDPEHIECAPHSIAIVLPPDYHVSYLTKMGWTINEYRTDLLDTRDRNAWLINASRA